MKFRYGQGGALVCDEPIEGITSTLDDKTAEYYGGKYFVGESMLQTAAEKIATLLGGEME